MRIRVFVQNEAGSTTKHLHDEPALSWQRAMEVSRAYPFPYGFVIGSRADDGGGVDCFVLTTRPLRTGQIVECEVAGLMEQIEDGQVDHTVLVRLPEEVWDVGLRTEAALTEFVRHVFDDVPGKQIEVGRFLGASDARGHLLVHGSTLTRHVTAGAIVVSGGRVLLGRRSPHRRHGPGTWDVFGGHVESGETLEEALVRELQEEAGIVATGWTQVGVLNESRRGLAKLRQHHLFVVTAWTGEPAMHGDEHDAIGWFTHDELQALTLTSSDYLALIAPCLDASGQP